MIFVLTCLGIALVVALVFALLLKTISLPEFACIMGVQLLAAVSAAAICYYSSTSDEQVINSYVTGKEKVKVSCSHSYRCNCYTTCTPSCSSKGSCSETCTEHCSTCYEHSHDYDWDVYNAMNETVTIDRIDRQGNDQPTRWTDVVMGDPTAITHNYENYVKAAPDTLFRNQGQTEKWAKDLPQYPIAVYDYYNLNRLVSVGVTLPETDRWNNELSELNAQLGSKKQVNIIVVVTKNRDESYFYALREAWIGGKKNDVILVVSVDDNLKPEWANVMSWELNELFNVKLRDAVMAQPALTAEVTIANLRSSILDYHQRKPMADFAYLKSSITPTTSQWIVSLIVQLALLAGSLFFFHINNPFETGYSYGRRPYSRY